MSKPNRLRILETLHEDSTGVVHLAKEGSGQKVHVRKPKPESGAQELPATEQVAYQVAIERLSGIHHPSLLRVVSGGSDPTDGLPYIATKPTAGESLTAKLKQRPLSIELATAMLSQALEVSELLSHLLADDGIWIETEPQCILVTEKSMEPCFRFWPGPLKAMRRKGGEQSFRDLIDLTERAMNWVGKEVDEREGSHLQMWLKWMKEAQGNTTVHEAREMLAAAAGVEPPEPIEELVEQCQHQPRRLARLPKLPAFFKWHAPKMPLFILLCVMLVAQSIIGWFIVRTINDSIDEELRQLNEGYTASPYTIDRDPDRQAETGSQPLDFD